MTITKTISIICLVLCGCAAANSKQERPHNRDYWAVYLADGAQIRGSIVEADRQSYTGGVETDKPPSWLRALGTNDGTIILFWGGVLSSTRYVAGQQHGVKYAWLPQDGRHEELRVEEWYCDGARDGPEIRWYSNGQIAQEFHWRTNVPCGTWRTWHPNGQLASIREQNGFDKVGEELCWYPSGAIQAKIIHTNGMQLSRIEWNEDGSIKTNKASNKHIEHTEVPRHDGCGMK